MATTTSRGFLPQQLRNFSVLLAVAFPVVCSLLNLHVLLSVVVDVDAYIIPSSSSTFPTTRRRSFHHGHGHGHLIVASVTVGTGAHAAQVPDEIYIDLDPDSMGDDFLENNYDGLSSTPYNQMSREEASEQRREWIEQLRKLAKSSSRDPSAVQKAESIFDEMFQAYIVTSAQHEDSASTFWPDVEVYNYLLETHAFAIDDDDDDDNNNNKYNGAEAAEELLERMEDRDNQMIVRPNSESYSHVINAWANRSQPRRAVKVLQRQIDRWQQQQQQQQQRLHEKSNNMGGDLHPTADSFNKLIKAWGIVGDVDRAERIFDDMVESGDDDGSGNTDDDDWVSPSQYGIRADQKTWVQLMKVYLGSTNDYDMKNQGPARVEGLFNEMVEVYGSTGDEAYKPQTAAYNQLIRSIDDPKRAEKILFDMIGQRDPETRPDSETFRQVIATYNNNNNNNNNKRRKSQQQQEDRPDAVPLDALAAKIEQIIQIQHGLYETTGKSDDLRLDDDRLCQVALNVIAKSRDAKKAVIAKRVFDKFRSSTTLSSKSYYNLIKVCAYSRGKSEDRFEAFQIVREAMRELQASPHLTVDSRCTGMILKALSNLMPDGAKRDKVAETVFQLCADAGLVDDFVLDQFSLAASPLSQLQVLGGFSVDYPTIPKKWQRNIK